MKVAHVVVGLGLLVGGGQAPLAHAVDLTGTWTGKIVCTTFDPTGKSRDVVTDDILLITQTGVDLNLSAEGGDFTYDGKVIDDPATPHKKGEATFIECRTTPANTDTSEMGRTKVVIKSDRVGATFTAQSILSDPSPVFQTCKWSYQRLDTTDPGVAACGAMPLAGNSVRRGHH